MDATGWPSADRGPNGADVSVFQSVNALWSWGLE
jgi:hypothetical protein